MGKKLTQSESTSKQNQTNTYGFINQPDNPYYKNAESLIGDYDGGASAAREAYGKNINSINNSGNEFLGASTPDYVRDKVRESRLIRNNTDLGNNLANAKQNEIGYKNSAYMGLGAATAPEFVQTGASASGSGTAYTPLLGTLGTNLAESFGSGLGGTAGKALGL